MKNKSRESQRSLDFLRDDFKAFTSQDEILKAFSSVPPAHPTKQYYFKPGEFKSSLGFLYSQ